MAAVASSRWMQHIGGGWGDMPPYYVKHFEYPEKRYTNVKELSFLSENAFVFQFLFNHIRLCTTPLNHQLSFLIKKILSLFLFKCLLKVHYSKF